jgi:hypothetical protein
MGNLLGVLSNHAKVDVPKTRGVACDHDHFLLQDRNRDLYASLPILPQSELVCIACEIVGDLTLTGSRSFTTGKYYLKTYDMSRYVFAPIFGCLYLLSHRYKVISILLYLVVPSY